ncbi:hypothetical protein C2869_01800 [Saccharobesus litoralis]|uniref:HTH araC/xylS-type domain-containing protein n=1 Tax=Saccharobesus litoralis TaxID=2172099 RepID=A0A2S0VM28_9ALTE|nr:helix-turn-helix transcriptional regulator [Saccharobesus litoralis]AWB65255.1 hypothetical protein C2869_01800 [Saccharobesus litoralis]
MAFKTNPLEVKGVLHKHTSDKHYTLRRYLPSDALSNLVEQYWFVNWSLLDGTQHAQENLPDPNSHLVFEYSSRVSGMRLMGPVSKKYQYIMQGSGYIVGVKFQSGALVDALGLNSLDWLDKVDKPDAKFGFNSQLVAQQIQGIHEINVLSEPSAKTKEQMTLCDQQVILLLEKLLLPLSKPVSRSRAQLIAMLSVIKSDQGIDSVVSLANHFGLSVRSVQRTFRHFLGISPKLLIRKYRLHQALTMLDQGLLDILDLVERLGYTDQSHLIKDFRDLVGQTPKSYQAYER